MLVVLCGVFAAIATLRYSTSAESVSMTTFMQTNLVSDIPGMAQHTDPNLANPWGMALGLNGGLAREFGLDFGFDIERDGHGVASG